MADVNALALEMDVIFEEAPTVGSLKIEVLADDQNFIPFQELRATVVGRHTLVVGRTTPSVQDYTVEVLADDQSFVPLPELRSTGVGRHTLTRAPMQVPVRSYVVEVLAETELGPIPAALAKAVEQDVVWEEIPTPEVSNYVVEVLGGASFEPQVSSYMMEVLGDDTTPNAIYKYVVEVLADSTDPVQLTTQQIVWFFSEH